MSILKSIYSSVYCSFAQRGYSLFHRNEGKETIYWKLGKRAFSKKYLIFVEDEEVGKRLYDVLSTLKKSKFDIDQAFVEFIKFGVSRKNVVKWFVIEVEALALIWEEHSKLEILRSLKLFVEAMSQKSLILDDALVYFECDSISEFLSFFSLSASEEKVKRAEGLLIEYIHHVLSNGQNLNELFDGLTKKGFFTESDVPYGLSVAIMCYRYASSGFISKYVYNILMQEEHLSAEVGEKPWIVVLEDFQSIYKVTEKTSEYTVYDGSYKIYDNISFKFKNFLRDFNFKSKTNSLEKLEALIVDLNGKTIGYKFSKCDTVWKNSYEELAPKSQADVFLYNIFLRDFLINNTYSAPDSTIHLSLKERLIFNSEMITYPLVKTLEDSYKLAMSYFDDYKEEMVVLFFELLKKYIWSKYGELTKPKHFLSKNEIRYLPPVVARDFINFALKGAVNYSDKLGEEVVDTLFDKKLEVEKTKDGKNNEFYIDNRFEISEFGKEFLFDYEVIKKYGLKSLKRGTEVELSDGRILTVLESPDNLRFFSDEMRRKRRIFDDKLNTWTSYIEFINVSKVIFRKNRLDEKNMYQVIGYVTEPISARKLTNDVFLNLNNKDMLKVLAYIYCSGEKCVHHSNYWMDDNFKFYLNYMKDSLKLEQRLNLKWTIESILSDGYNPYGFVVLESDSSNSYMNIGKLLLNTADNLDAYCNEHKIYYNSKKGQCPVCFKTKYIVPPDFAQRYRKVLEDDVAVHYNIDKMYNLKVYKNEYNKLLEERVRKTVETREKGINYLYQDCLVPLKLALDANREFIGYVYEAVEFDETKNGCASVCQDIANLSNLSNLPRVKSLIRLVTQVKEMLDNRVGFTNNPFSYVFLNTDVKRQVQILNVEFLTENGDRKILKQTREWTREYISKVINLDSTIKLLYLSKLSENLDDIMTELRRSTALMTKYCGIHNTWYDGIKYICCPHCVAPEDYSEKLIDIMNFNISSDPINEGGEAFIYSMPNNTVLKVFKDDSTVDKDFKGIILCKILTKKEILEKINEENHKFKYVIPKDIYVHRIENKILGYTMDHIQNANPISILRDKVEVQKLGLSRKDIFEILITIGEGIETLHKETGIYIGDLNGRNILFDEDKNVYFLDFDGMGIDEIKPEFCTDGYIDPVSKKNQSITMKDDWYSYAIQAFYYLTYTHPFNGVYTEIVNGQRWMLEIPEKMERRISLLGNHNMKAPDIAVSWDWMNADLKKTFLDIFEGESRESIVLRLKEQYQILFPKIISTEETILQESEQTLENIFRVNPKFIAKELNSFKGKVIKVFKPQIALCEETNSKYISVLNQNNEEIKIDLKTLDVLLEYENINDVSLSEDYRFLFVICIDDKLLIIDLSNQKLLAKSNISSFEKDKIVVDGQTVFLVNNDTNLIYKIFFDLEQEQIAAGIVGNPTRNKIKCFNAKFGNKFLIIIEKNQTQDELYCNSKRFGTITYNSAEEASKTLYNIIYDKTTKLWLVINNDGAGLVIKPTGEDQKIYLGKYIDDVNFGNIYFKRNKIYIPGNNVLYIANVGDENQIVKTMECNKIMAPESKIYEITSTGFKVITNNVFYEVSKG